ncbi:guanylin-like isoform X3 [Ascaphus truei]|uniref:guanylin-like isoform X3 n=1 Tax=Ascaphus truei TaxID=8439 RepID=UPI003F59469C
MKSSLLPMVLILLLWPGSQAIKIQVGKFTFGLESVITLKELMEVDGKEPSVASQFLCDDPKLPKEFHIVCEEDDASDIFVKLVEAASNVDECELCANPACPGCI